MILGIVLLIVAGSLLGLIILLRSWAIERRGIDPEVQSMNLGEVQHFSSRQKVILGLLMVPAALLLVGAVAYVLASVVVTAVGASAPPV